jgi:putative phage-type endonuclease
MNRADWLEQRRTGIGGSDIAAIAGVSPWRTAVDVYFEKRAEAPPAEESPAMYWGTQLEDLVAREYAKRTQRRVQRVNAILRNRYQPWQMASLDRAVINPDIAGRVIWRQGRLTTDRILECKTANGFAANLWGEPGSDQLPDAYLLQCQWYMGVTGVEHADLAVLIGGQDFRVYHIARDQDTIDLLVALAAEFWSDCQAGRPPIPTTAADAARLWPRHQPGKAVIVNTELAATCTQLATLGEARRQMERQEAVLKAARCTACGDAETITHQGKPLATWKTKTSRRIDVTRLKAEHAALAEQYTVTAETRELRLLKG